MKVSREFRILASKHVQGEAIATDIIETCKLIEERAGLTPAETVFMMSLAAAENKMWFLAHQLATLASLESHEWAGQLAKEFLKGVEQVHPSVGEVANEIAIDEIL